MSGSFSPRGSTVITLYPVLKPAFFAASWVAFQVVSRNFMYSSNFPYSVRTADTWTIVPSVKGCSSATAALVSAHPRRVRIAARLVLMVINFPIYFRIDFLGRVYAESGLGADSARMLLPWNRCRRPGMVTGDERPPANGVA